MTKCVLIEVSAVRSLSEKAVLVIENLNTKTPIPKSAYFGRGDNYFEHWVAEWVLGSLKREYVIKSTKLI